MTDVTFNGMFAKSRFAPGMQRNVRGEYAPDGLRPSHRAIFEIEEMRYCDSYVALQPRKFLLSGVGAILLRVMSSLLSAEWRLPNRARAQSRAVQAR